MAVGSVSTVKCAPAWASPLRGAVIPRLPELKELGVTAIEIMPVGQFPGSRNWGYDGVLPYPDFRSS
ncbi:MAG: hypothetical protein LC808_31560, partial [Actinobacteria bacterium]|nr:hypothetical protein [Actinomycetota bacterium]